MVMKYTKRIFDILISMVGICMISPLYIIISFSILLFDGKPILFSQDRIGRFGKVFKIYKFRSMVNDSSERTTYITTESDSRITPLGTYLRKYKFDELPELWNVLIGDMSFVGPRPDMPGYVDNLIGDDQRLLQMKPGITGPATLKYANEEQILAEKKDPQKYNDEVLFPNKVKINLEYMDNWSFLEDIRIILKTIFRKNY